MTLEERTGSASEPLVSKDDLRARFARRLSEMYAQEVPLYGTLLETVVALSLIHI